MSAFRRLLSLCTLKPFVLTEEQAELVAFYFPYGPLLAEDETSALPLGFRNTSLRQQDIKPWFAWVPTPAAEVLSSCLLLPSC